MTEDGSVMSTTSHDNDRHEEIKEKKVISNELQRMTSRKSYLHFVQDHLDFMKKSCKGMQADVRDRLLSCDSSSLSEGKDVSG